MAIIGSIRSFPFSIASAVTSSSAIDIGGSYGKIMVGIPTMTSATDIYPEVSDAIDGVFRRVYHEPRVDSTTPTPINYASTVTNCYIPLEVNAQYLRLTYTSATTESAQTFKFLCSTN